VVVPSYNQGEFLRATLDSILSQGYPDVECIVVDGGSSDHSVEIIRSLEDRLTWWCSEKDDGHGDALNKGFAKATGEVLCWLNSDDLMAPWGLWVVGDVFARFPEVEWLTGEYGIWDAHGRLVASYPGGATATEYLRRNESDIQQESTFWRRSLWTRAGGEIDTSYRLMIDAELWLRFFRHATLYSLKTVVSGYRWHGENRSLTQADRTKAERWRAIGFHLAPRSWRTRLVARFGPDQYERQAGFGGALKFIFCKKVRQLLLRRPRIPVVTWDAPNHCWKISSRRLRGS
jgi:glycosyltransferase involved in cell wall biosynthesis